MLAKFFMSEMRVPDILKQLQNKPQKYPCTFILIDLSNECKRIYIETVQVHELIMQRDAFL